MRSVTLPVRVLFCIVTAVAAAAIADPIVEALSNAGVFGPGVFTDRSMVDVVPALICAGFFAIAFTAMRVTGSWSSAAAREALARSARVVPRQTAVRLLPVIAMLQFGVLYAMETLEQIVVYGHVLSPSLWLGGPALYSIALHLLACAVVAGALNHGLHSLARSAAQAAEIVREWLCRAANVSAPPLLLGRHFAHTSHRAAPVFSRRNPRAPPVFAA